jgi:CubicO group peptidase (beta-lactamase class C family)
MQGIVDKQHLAGIVTLLARHGQVVQHKAYGLQDIESRAPMQLDTIVRIYSMTKPIAGAAMMMLYEEGKWQPSDPIAKHIPEFANLKVFSGVDKDGKPTLLAPAHAPTMGELMSHNAGFTYGLFGNSPVDKMYQADNPLDAPSLRAFIGKMATLPLLYQPGEKWVYSVSVDIQG